MARERRGATEESTAVPDQRQEPALAPDEGRDDAPKTGAAPGGREGSGPPAGPVAPTAERSPLSPDEAEPAAETPHDHKVGHTRLSGTWAAVVGFGIVLLLLLIFILQNQHTVDVSYFGAHGHLALGVALLLSAVAGVLLVALAGSARIMQLRATARRHRRADRKTAKAGQR